MAYPSDIRGSLQHWRDTLNTGNASTTQYPDNEYGLLQNIRDLLNTGSASTAQYPKDMNGLITNIRDLLNTGSASVAKYTGSKLGLWSAIQDLQAVTSDSPPSIYGIVTALGTAGASTPPAWVFDEQFTTGSYYPRAVDLELVDTRSTTKYVTDTSGLMSSVAINALPISNAGMLVEPGATNLLLQSGDFTQTVQWPVLVGAVTRTAAATTGPDGTLTGQLIADNATAVSQYGLKQVITATANQNYTCYFILKKKDYQWVNINAAGSNSGNHSDYFDILNGVKGNAGSGTSTFDIIALTNGWYLCWVNFTANGSDTTLTLTCSAVAANGGGTRAGVVGTGTYYWGAWASNANSAALNPISSYVPTTTVSASRAADSIQVQRTGIDKVVYVFDDNSTATFDNLGPNTNYVIPTTLSRRLIKRMTGYGPASSYTGQIATGSTVANNIDITTNKQFNSRSRHVMRETLSSFKIVLPSFYITAGFAEGAISGTTVTAAIEYPVGTFTQVTFNTGATSAALPVTAGSAFVISDSIALSIPLGAQFFVRCFWSSTSGIIWSTQGGSDVANGTLFEAAASGLTDKTMGGNITDGFSGLQAYRPCAIIGTTSKATIGIFGDSRNAGLGSAPNAAGDNGELARTLGPSFAYINMGCPSDKADKFIGSHANRVALMQYCSHILNGYGINDINIDAQTDATLLANQQTIGGYFPGKPYYLTTLSPDSRPSNTGPNNSTFNGYRIAYNTSVRAGVTGVTAFFDIASVTENSLNGGLWVAGYSDDFLHANNTGYTAIQTSAIVTVGSFHRP